MTYAAATDSAMVMDVSVTIPTGAGTYQKYGGSVVLDFEDDNAQFYAHGGNGEGYGSGMSYSVGLVDNYDSPEDYSGPFIDINAGYDIGVDHCWDPRKPHGSATQATALSFSSGLNYGLGVDVYSRPVQLFEW